MLLNNTWKAFLVLTSSPVVICVNYTLSEWMYRQCDRRLPVYIGMLSAVQIVVAITLYVTTWRLANRHARHVIKQLHGLDAETFCRAMIDCKQLENSHIKSSENIQNDPKPTNTDAGNTTTRNCVVCYERYARAITYPCRHVVLCGECTWTYVLTCLRGGRNVTCVVCRTEVTSYSGDVAVSLNNKNLANVLEKYSSGKHLIKC